MNTEFLRATDEAFQAKTRRRRVYGLAFIALLCVALISMILVTVYYESHHESSPGSSASCTPAQLPFAVKVVRRGSRPFFSYPENTVFRQSFNPSWIVGSPGTNGRSGLLVRSQNCTMPVGTGRMPDCVFCSGAGAKASVLTWTEEVLNVAADAPDSALLSSSASSQGVLDNSVPLVSSRSYSPVSSSSVVFGPSSDADAMGTEDPRVVFDSRTGLYHMFYTAYGYGMGSRRKSDVSTEGEGDGDGSEGKKGKSSTILLSHATTTDPTSAKGWTRHGPVFPHIQGSKSGALLINPRISDKGKDGTKAKLSDSTEVHHLFWGDSTIKLATSQDLFKWPADGGRVWLSPRADAFDSKLVESGPPPLPLSDGNFIFFYNSADFSTVYHPGWVILDGKDPSRILARSDTPLLTPRYAWELGARPYACNVPNVVFLEAARPLTQEEWGASFETGDNDSNDEKPVWTPDTFRVYYGGADMVLGSAVVQVQRQKNA